METWGNFKMPPGGTSEEMRLKIEEHKKLVQQDMYFLSRCEQGVLRRALRRVVKTIWPDGDA